MNEINARSKRIARWLRNRPLVSVYGLEEVLGIGHGTIAKAVARRRDIPAKHLDRIEKELSKYGYQPEAVGKKVLPKLADSTESTYI